MTPSIPRSVSSMDTSIGSTIPDDDCPQSRFSASSTNEDNRSSVYTQDSSFYGQLETDPPGEADFQHHGSVDWANFVQAAIKDHGSDELPTNDQLEEAGDVSIYDAKGKAKKFRSLYAGDEVTEQRQLIVFIRFFYCTSCQLYIKALTNALPHLSDCSSQASVPMSTSITIIGCGHPSLISNYIRRTKCPYPVYADPHLKLFKHLGCRRWAGIKLGRKSEYGAEQSTTKMVFGTIYDQIKAGVRAGEFALPDAEEAGFIEPEMTLASNQSKKSVQERLAPGIASTTIPEDGILTTSRRASAAPTTALPDMPPRRSSMPSARPSGLRKRISLDGLRGGSPLQVGGEFLFSQGRPIWCHRMTNIRDHAEMKTIRRVLDVSDDDRNSDVSSHAATLSDDEYAASLTGSIDSDNNASTQDMYNLSIDDSDLDPLSHRPFRPANDVELQLGERSTGKKKGLKLIYDITPGETPRAHLGRASPAEQPRGAALSSRGRSLEGRG